MSPGPRPASPAAITTLRTILRSASASGVGAARQGPRKPGGSASGAGVIGVHEETGEARSGKIV